MVATPPYTQNTVLLKTAGYRNEFAAGNGAITPGHLLIGQSDGSVVPHNVVGGQNEKLFAIEDSLQGAWFYNQATGGTFFFGSGDFVPTVRAVPGDHILAVVPANATAFVAGAPLISNGDGTLVVSSTLGSHTIYANVADSAAIASSAATVVFDKNYTFPANFFQVGDIITVRGLVNSIGVTATPTFRTVLQAVDSGAVTVTFMDTSTVSVIASDLVEFECTIMIRTIGATGTAVAFGWYTAGTPGTAVQKPFQMTSTTINTTLTQLFEVTGKWSASSASNTAKLGEIDIELSRVNPQSLVAWALVALDNSAVAAIARTPVRIAG